MSNYLLEIGCEELPANFLEDAEVKLKEAVSEELKQEHLEYKTLITYSTPRRVAVLVQGLDVVQPTLEKKIRGPKVSASFDDQGAPLPAALGFASKNGLAVDELEKETIGSVEYLVANLTLEGRAAQDVIAGMAPKLIKGLSGERMMRWGDGDLKFARPIRWLVSIFDDQVVPFQLEELRADRVTHGHRVLAKVPISLSDATQYKPMLAQAGVTVDRTERRDLIRKLVEDASLTVQGRPRKTHASLLEEVVNITESPCAVVGSFSSEYLDLPEMLIETIMVHHQRYFPIESPRDGKLLPYFITIANNTITSALGRIKEGNERVLKARLADGRFFYFDDQKTSLQEHAVALSHLTFQEGLGTYADKIARLTATGAICAKQLSLSPEETTHLERIIRLAKADLVTSLVRELPELQGFVGAWYAERENEAPPVVTAISSHYSPRSPEDDIPQDKLGKIASLLDKLDSLVGGFLMGRKPTGSSDPYALRRQAQGLIDICMASGSNLRFNVSALVEELLRLLSTRVEKSKLTTKEAGLEIADFLLQRLKGNLLGVGFNKEIVEAVTSTRDALADLTDAQERCRALQKFAKSETGLNVLRVGLRVANIVSEEPSSQCDHIQLSEPSEVALFKRFETAVVERWGPMPDEISHGQYFAYLESFHDLAPLIDDFFDKLLVNDPDPVKRTNRRKLLANINERLRYVADFSKLQPLLN